MSADPFAPIGDPIQGCEPKHEAAMHQDFSGIGDLDAALKFSAALGSVNLLTERQSLGADRERLEEIGLTDPGQDRYKIEVSQFGQ